MEVADNNVWEWRDMLRPCTGFSPQHTQTVIVKKGVVLWKSKKVTHLEKQVIRREGNRRKDKGEGGMFERDGVKERVKGERR